MLRRSPEPALAFDRFAASVSFASMQMKAQCAPRAWLNPPRAIRPPPDVRGARAYVAGALSLAAL